MERRRDERDDAGEARVLDEEEDEPEIFRRRASLSCTDVCNQPSHLNVDIPAEPPPSAYFRPSAVCS